MIATAPGVALPKIVGASRTSRSGWRLAWRRLRRDRSACIALVVLVVLVLLAIGAPALPIADPLDQDLVGAVRAVGRGEAFLTNAAERSLVRQWMEEGRSGPREPLTPREEEVVKLIAEAFTNVQIAEILHLSEKTVESHRANVLRKLGMRDRVELVRYAIRRGLTEA